MPVAKVNGVETEFEPGMTVLQVAERAGQARDVGIDGEEALSASHLVPAGRCRDPDFAL